MSLPVNCMYPSPQENETTHIHELVQNKRQAFQRAFELTRRNLNEKQKRQNATFSKKGSRSNIQRRKDKKFCFIFQPSPLEQLLSSQALGRDPVSLKNV